MLQWGTQFISLNIHKNKRDFGREYLNEASSIYICWIAVKNVNQMLFQGEEGIINTDTHLWNIQFPYKLTEVKYPWIGVKQKTILVIITYHYWFFNCKHFWIFILWNQVCLYAFLFYSFPRLFWWNMFTNHTSQKALHLHRQCKTHYSFYVDVFVFNRCALPSDVFPLLNLCFSLPNT